ncbi:hypothetical protein BLS_005125 [Venturia inaequalis]|uniref:Uncharacterized protein n=1 Tax=Venturia inaequalis TaxID=5025 RepID=A0A8H3YS62_VENIN|nr:hypothetical protein BLS_005125 [Venturia inaequalis]KAE9990689.1 hypothetical protein EG327_001084 [Venturia inaequalis]
MRPTANTFSYAYLDSPVPSGTFNTNLNLPSSTTLSAKKEEMKRLMPARQGGTMEMEMESSDLRNADRVPGFGAAEAVRESVVDDATMGFVRGANEDAERRGGERKESLRGFAGSGKAWRVKKGGQRWGEGKAVVDDVSGGKKRSLKAKHEGMLKRKFEGVESDDDGDALEPSPAHSASPSEDEAPHDDDYDPKGKGKAKKSGARKSTKKTPKNGDSKPTKTEKGKTTKKAKVQATKLNCHPPTESDEDEAKENIPPPSNYLNPQFQRSKNPRAAGFLVAVKLQDQEDDGMPSQIPTQTPLIAASTPQYTALCRLHVSMEYSLFIKTIAAKFSITDDEQIGRLVPSLRWLHTPIGEENVSDVLEWLEMRGGEAYVSVLLMGGERSLVAGTTRVKPGESLELEAKLEETEGEEMAEDEDECHGVYYDMSSNSESEPELDASHPPATVLRPQPLRRPHAREMKSLNF